MDGDVLLAANLGPTNLLPEIEIMFVAPRHARFSLIACLFACFVLPLTASAQLTSTPSSVTFTNTYIGMQSTSKSITVKNTGTSNVTINSITSSCPEFKLASGTTPVTLAAGKTTSYSMFFAPDKAQAFSCNYTLAATGTGNLSVPMSSTGLSTKAIVSVSPTSMNFLNQQQGTKSATQTITITNSGTASIKLTGITIAPVTFANSSVTLPLTINAGANKTLTVTYSPQLVTSETGVIAFSFNQVPNKVVDLTGTGIAPTKLVITNVTTLPAATQSAKYQASLLAKGGTAPFTYTLKSGSVLPTGLTLSGAGLISGTLDASVAVGAYPFTIQVSDSKGHLGSKGFTLNVGAATGANCANISFNIPNTSTPIVPLNDLGTGTYQGSQGGLYPNGSNVRPSSHDADGVDIAEGIGPLNASGNPDPSGKLVLLAIGESTALDEFTEFLAIAKTDPALNSSMVIVDGAQGAATPKLLASSTSPYWNTIINNYLPDQGVTANQVVAVWIEDSNGIATGSFPGDMTGMQGNYESVMNNVHTFFPNAKLAYFSSRIYAGYSNGVATINPEPYAYESAFAVKWAIQDQINGASNLNYDAGLGVVKAPWMAWGPYYWGNGLLARSDGGVWSCQDLQADGTHPAIVAGELKVAGQILNFFKSDLTTKPWFLHP